MSTFGKSSLIWWDYHTRDRAALLRFNSTPKPLQIKILEKWYPIGSKVGLGDGKYEYIVYEHVQHLTYWQVRITINKNNQQYFQDRNPLGLYLHPDVEKTLKRNSKLDRLLDNGDE